MFDSEKILTHFATNKGKQFAVKDIELRFGLAHTTTKSHLAYLVKIGALSRSGEKGKAYRYELKAHVDLTAKCKKCKCTSELVGMKSGLCGSCIRQKKKYPASHGASRDEVMAQLMTMPFGLSRDHYENLLKGTGDVTS